MSGTMPAMAARLDLPPALSALVDVGVALVRRAPSARIAIARAGDLFDPDDLTPALREIVVAEVEAARDATCVELRPKEVERLLREAWGRPPGKVLDALEPEPLAVRPAAQVHRAELDGSPVAVKVRRPGVERAVRNDLALLDAVAAPLRAAFPNLDAGAVLRDARESVLDELDLEHEASQQRRIARALREVQGVTVPRPHLELAQGGVLVTDFVEGTTLADGARPPDAGAAARALVEAFRAAALGAGLAPVDPRATHVIVRPDGSLALLGVGVARPVDRERAATALDALQALADDDAERFTSVVAGSGILPAGEAREAHAILREVLGELLDAPATLDAPALLALGDRAAAAAADLAALAAVGSPRTEDLALGRMLGQLVALLARLGASEDWVALSGG